MQYSSAIVQWEKFKCEMPIVLYTTCDVIHFLSSTQFFSVLFIRGENRVILSWNLKGEGNRGWVLFLGWPLVTCLERTKGLERICLERASRCAHACAVYPAETWPPPSTGGLTSPTIDHLWRLLVLNGQSRENHQDLHCVEKFKLLETWQVLYESFFAQVQLKHM